MDKSIGLIILLVGFAMLRQCTAHAAETTPADDYQTIVLGEETEHPAEMYVHRPSTQTTGGCAIIICPGGGYAGLTMDSEGHDTARFFARHGITAVVLRYRLPGRTDPLAPLTDAQSAIHRVREHAADWNLDPHRIGILGYSAGGHVAAMAATHFTSDTRPDFQMLIYPVISMGKHAHAGSRLNLLGKNPTAAQIAFFSAELNVTRESPPAFIAAANDDRTVDPINSMLYCTALQEARVPVELHLYDQGDHGLKGGKGWGIGGPTNSIASTWCDRAIDWLNQRKLIKPPDSSNDQKAAK